MLHSGSRGVGNRMGNYFIDVARKDMKKFFVNLPDVDLAYFPEHTEHFDDYVEAVEWAQDYARRNRDLMMEQIVGAVRASGEAPPFNAELRAIHCHHNYVARESHLLSALSPVADQPECQRTRPRTQRFEMREG